MPKDVWVDLNGVFHKKEEFLFKTSNRAFRFGDGIFETIFIRKGNPLYFHNHWERLNRGMEILGFEKREEFTEEFLLEKVKSLADKNEVSESGRIRIEIFRTEGGTYSPDSDVFEYLIECTPLENHKRFYGKPVSLCFFETIPVAYNLLSGVKSVSALPYVLAARHAKVLGFDDAILFTKEGSPAETSSSNIFVVKNKTIFTPPLSSGCLHGIMRWEVLTYAAKNGIKTKEVLFDKSFLMEADAVFTTNVIHGIRKVSVIEEEEMNSGFNDVVDGLCEGMSD